MALGIGLYLIPLEMIRKPELIALTQTTAAALIAFFQVGWGLGLISYAVIARPLKWKRPIFLVFGFVLISIV